MLCYLVVKGEPWAVTAKGRVGDRVMVARARAWDNATGKYSLVGAVAGYLSTARRFEKMETTDDMLPLAEEISPGQFYVPPSVSSQLDDDDEPSYDGGYRSPRPMERSWNRWNR